MAWRLTLLALLILAPVAATGAPPPARVAVLDLKDAGTLDRTAADGLSALVASEVARRPALAVVAGADLRAILGYERQRQLAGCSSTGCAADLGVAFLLTSEVTKVGSSWLLSLALLDAARASSVSRLTRKAAAIDGLLDEVPGAVDELLAPLGARAAKAATTRFDGAWEVALECPDVTEGNRAKGYAYRFPATVKEGKLRAQRLAEDAPGFLRLEGTIDADGQAQLSARGRTAGAEYTLKGSQPGTPYGYGVAARFEAARGTGRRSEGRPCTYTFVKE